MAPSGGEAGARPRNRPTIFGVHALRPAFASSDSFIGQPPSLRRRATSLGLALTATCLIMLLLLGLNARAPKRPQFKGSPILINLNSEKESSSAPATKQGVAKPKAGSKPLPPRPQKPKVVEPVPELPDVPYTPVIRLTRQEDDSFSLKMRTGAAARQSGEQQASAAGNSAPGDSRAIGNAPNGEPLYEAQWYRRPTPAELSFYLPKNMPSEGSGLIACRTVARYHVDDCVELGSSPPGSHLAGAVRQAAWQFLVRPPRRGGKELVGSWVRIRIDYRPKLAD
jgi:protein TonB